MENARYRDLNSDILVCLSTDTPQNVTCLHRQNSYRSTRMPSVDYSDPQSGFLTWQEVPIITSHTTFLHVPVNKPHLQFSALRDLVLNFSFPPSPHRFPLTVIRRIIVQTLISKLRPHLALQPISHQHAANLDHLIALKVHEYLGFPFRFKTLLLSTPLHLRGLGFPSVARINASLSVAGLHRDLNHHLPSFHKMAPSVVLGPVRILCHGGLSRNPPDLSGSARNHSDPIGIRSEFFPI